MSFIFQLAHFVDSSKDRQVPELQRSLNVFCYHCSTDHEIPVINCPVVDSVNVKNGTNGSTVNLMVTATDVVDGQVETTCWIEDDLGTKIYYPGYIFQVGDTIVTCNASDASGNTATCSFNVAVVGKFLRSGYP